MAVQHASLANSELHEPKDVSLATAGTLYHADGGGSGDWEFQEYALTVDIDDVSTAGSYWVVSPVAGTIDKVYTVLYNAITSANATVTLEIAGVPVTGGDVTIAFTGSAAGDVDSSTPSAANAVTAGQAIEIITDGGSSTAAKVTVTLLIKRTA